MCESCRDITSGVSLDVVEIDGASNRGIADIQQLRESVRFAATGGRYKVVHHRRGAPALGRRLRRAPQDARGAAAARRVRVRDHRPAQAARHHPLALPALRAGARAGARHRRAARHHRRRGDEGRPHARAHARRRAPDRAQGRGRAARRGERARPGRVDRAHDHRRGGGHRRARARLARGVLRAGRPDLRARSRGHAGRA